MAKFLEYGISLSHEDAEALLPWVRERAVNLKRALFDKELVYVYEDFRQGTGGSDAR